MLQTVVPGSRGDALPGAQALGTGRILIPESAIFERILRPKRCLHGFTPLKVGTTADPCPL